MKLTKIGPNRVRVSDVDFSAASLKEIADKLEITVEQAHEARLASIKAAAQELLDPNAIVRRLSDFSQKNGTV